MPIETTKLDSTHPIEEAEVIPLLYLQNEAASFEDEVGDEEQGVNEDDEEEEEE